MPTAYSTAEDLRFPDRCVRCDAPADAWHKLQASRGIDLIVFAVYESLDVPVPVCAACKRRRAWSGFAMYAGALIGVIAILLAGIFLGQAGEEVAGGALAVLAFAIAIAIRMRGKSILEWNTLGLDIDLLKGAEHQLRLEFRREAPFNAWRAVNPHASLTTRARVASARA